ncbi:MAG: Fis family transcriptional regulator [Methylophilaceae bacterium]|nr:Fis family transcriptional regulator [Methylophilaceae bacterium]
MKKCDLAESVTSSLDTYFENLEHASPHAIYDMVLGAVEKSLLEYIIHKVNGNQSKAAEILGLNRNTLRRKLKHYHLD